MEDPACRGIRRWTYACGRPVRLARIPYLSAESCGLDLRKRHRAPRLYAFDWPRENILAVDLPFRRPRSFAARRLRCDRAVESGNADAHPACEVTVNVCVVLTSDLQPNET